MYAIVTTHAHTMSLSEFSLIAHVVGCATYLTYTHSDPWDYAAQD